MRREDAEMLKAGVNCRGYVHLPEIGSVDDFDSLCAQVGTIMARRTVRIDTSRPERLNNPPAMPLHTDHPDANFVAWYCYDNIPHGGESLIIDGLNVLAALPAEILNGLQSIDVRYNNIDDQKLNFCPILRQIGTRQALCYAPWLVEEPTDSNGYRILRAFETALWIEQLDNLCSIQLKKSDALFIDNHRFLHGRRSLPAQCSRELTRRWIRSFAT